MSQDLPIATSYALLGLLTFGDELTGYELKQRADNTLRFYWVAPAMSQIYSELARLTSHGLVEPTTSDGAGRRTTTYRITVHGRAALSDWIAESRVGFPVLKHTVLLRLLIGHVSEPERIAAMLEEYVAELAVALDDLREVRDSLRGARRPGRGLPLPLGRRRLGTRLLRRRGAAHPPRTRPTEHHDPLGGTVTSRTLYSCTMSLDGFMAGPGGDMQWLTKHLGPNPVADGHRVAGRLAAGRASYVRRRRPEPRDRRTRARSAGSGTARRSCSPTRRPPSRCPTPPS